MTTRLVDPPLHKTENLLAEVLKVILKAEGNRVLFLCDAGRGPDVVQRIRVMISRNRRRLEEKGSRPRRFRLKSSIHSETHDGIRYDACVLWMQVTTQNQMLQDLEGMLSNG